MRSDLPGASQRKHSPIPLYIALVYALAGALWIVLSDRAVEVLAPSADWAATLQTYKGWGYVAVTAVILYLAIRRFMWAIEDERDRLWKSQDRFRGTLDGLLEGCQIIGFDWRYIYVNPAAVVHNQYREDQLLGRTMMECFPGIENTAVFAAATKCMRERLSQRWEGEFVFPNGSAGWFDVCIEPAPEGIFILSVDNTARRRAQVALNETQALLQRAVTAGNIGLWEWDLRTDRMVHSLEWKRQIGYEDHEINGSLSEWSERLHSEDRDRAETALRAYAARPAGVYKQEYRLRHKDGSYRWILAQGSVPEGDPLPAARIVGTHVDITDHKTLEEQFLQAQKMESVGRLAGGVAHDFNNLLAVINGYSDMVIAELPEGSPIREDAVQIRQAGDRAAALTRQLLAFSRKQLMQPRVLNLNAQIQDSQSMLRRLIGEDVRLEVSLAADLGSVRADPAQIEQVIMNLAVNARDAMPNGGSLNILTRNAELDEELTERPSQRTAPHIMLAVSDSGTGMDKATLARIFDPFFTTKEQGKGTGLGLSTVYGIVRQSGGHVFVYSEVDKGTTFKIFLPRVDERPQEVGAPEPHTAAGGTETILVAEDDDTLRTLTVRILKAAGYRVLSAANGTEALKLLEETDEPVHGLLTDVVMPGISGKALADHACELRPHLRVVFMSGYLEDTAAHHGVLTGTAHFISKPFTANALNAKLREALDAPRQQEARDR